ncbi:MAG TPA: YggS family pyridoxal phosphate-dependent enzyme [Kofleriaceae bacterium]|nr:YggS family pyridoxal phosphate-dependent enzyme [Kofleriaceae bacterium]
MTATADIAANWRVIRQRVDDAATRAGRDPATVQIIAVAKKQPASAVRAALATGAVHIGENYVQELLGKRDELAADAVQPQWHFIGHLQRNKARMIAGQVALIHAVDSIELAAEIAKRSVVRQPVLLAVNLGGEGSKSGVSAADVVALARAVVAINNLRCDGLMTMPPPDLDDNATRAIFRELRTLRDELQQQLGTAMPTLSMGMSSDFELAIAEGATHVRIGTAIFGAR